jgi:MFS family permease
MRPGAHRTGGGLSPSSACASSSSSSNTILNVALPSIERSLHASASQLQWTVDAYTLTFASLLLVAGNLGDRYGRRGALLTGLVIFGVGSALAAFASMRPR